MLGIFVFTTQGTSGSILYMVNHGVATAALFLAAGYLVHRKGTASMSAITGMEKTAPVLAGVFLLSGLAVLGLPGLSQFVSEIMVIIAAFQHHVKFTFFRGTSLDPVPQELIAIIDARFVANVAEL